MSDSTKGNCQAADSEEHLIFVYGTLKQGQPNYPYLMDTAKGHAQFVAQGHTCKKYPLVIAGKYNIPYLLDKPGDGDHVRGDIYKVDTQKRDFLDDFESHPTYYERTQEDIAVMDENSGATKIFKCWVYFMKNYKPSMLDLPRWSNYDSFGPHGLRYVERYERTISGYDDLEQTYGGQN